MSEFITLVFYKNKALEETMKVHDSLKEAKKWAKDFLKNNSAEEGYSVEITQF